MIEKPYLEESAHLLLRPLTLEDSSLIVSWRNEESVRIRYIYREKFTLEGQEKYFHEKVESGKVAQFIGCGKRSGAPVGCSVISDLDREKGTGEYGMFIGDPASRGKGYGRELGIMTLRYAFGPLGLSHLYARIFTDNIPSIRGHEAAGFRMERLIPGVVCSDGEVKDMVLLGADKESWPYGAEER